MYEESSGSNGNSGNSGSSDRSLTSKRNIGVFSSPSEPNQKEMHNMIALTDNLDGSSQPYKSDEDTATEKWKRKNHKKRKSYLTPNAYLKHLNLNINSNKRLLPLIKNRGSRAEDLKALNLKGYGKIILTNTCAFDTAVSLFMAALCDSNTYLKIIDQSPSNSFIIFTKTVLTAGISVDTYRKIAKIIIEKQTPVQTPLKYDQIMYKCDKTFSSLLNCMIPELPTICDHKSCNRCTDKIIQYCQTSYIYNGNFENLVECINE